MRDPFVEVVRFSSRSGPVEAMAFSSDGRLLALGSSDGTTIIYDILSEQVMAVLPGHGGAVRSVAFSPDNKLLATASDDRTVRLWSLGWRPPRPDLDWKSLLKYLRGETKTCLSAEQRSRLLSETSKEAYEKYAACEMRYGRKAPPEVPQTNPPTSQPTMPIQLEPVGPKR